ncbi:DUF721 domain-containing protein [Aurantibacter aestuarii]|uniref:DUF721 domain-containing protein n=1 Tax=Aurantibacter aestuarii TaxID=1266046 RepID=A0A2T1N531_9FLAO|nr:DUF721 domain-containing protein [Aurantibacter aestuarii]PSG86388.1 DUF721 domain-containing protein [Aurantibacter aestuarii]
MSKRNNDILKFSEALSEFVSDHKLDEGLDKVKIYDAWKTEMGSGVNNYTTAIEFKRGTLYVQLSSSVLREELSYGKEKIITMLNGAIGKPIISKLVLR